MRHVHSLTYVGSGKVGKNLYGISRLGSSHCPWHFSAKDILFSCLRVRFSNLWDSLVSATQASVNTVCLWTPFIVLRGEREPCPFFVLPVLVTDWGGDQRPTPFQSLKTDELKRIHSGLTKNNSFAIKQQIIPTFKPAGEDISCLWTSRLVCHFRDQGQMIDTGVEKGWLLRVCEARAVPGDKFSWQVPYAFSPNS